MKRNELDLKNKEEYLLKMSNRQELLVFAVEIKGFSFYANLSNDDYYKYTIVSVRNELKNRLKNENCFIYRNKKLLVFYEINNNSIRKSIKRIKRKFRKIILKENTFFKFSTLEFILGIAKGKKNTVIKKAILALDYSKKYNLKSTIYNPYILTLVKKELSQRIEDEKIKKIVLSKNIIPFYQKVIDNNSLEVVKYESLARIHDGNEVLTPDKFLNTIRYLGLFDIFTRNIINIVFSDVYLQNKIKAASINITAEDVRNRTTLSLIEKLLKTYGGDRITFEITETIGVDDYHSLISFTQMLKNYNAKISIDDFGSGHSGYEHLIQLDVDFIKIDGKFIKVLKENKKARNLIQGLCQFSKKHNIKVIAEYVETEEIFKIIKNLGVDFSQGYLFGKPLEM
ncbi:EAL domain-containing protein (plasmid) [Aliarcobacter lanthieri]|uniref:EAL domain-containing protein n=1 Tax=Aliarcobacter lanthieri TaxID=1355374 RepID=UPI003AAD9D58